MCEKEYHILSLSGGKDSTALAFFIKDNMPEVHEKIQYIFCDTECELPETYDYLNKIELFLGKEIKRIKPFKNFEYLMSIYNYFPSPIRRWCTIEMKTKPFRKYIYDMFQEKGEGKIHLYLGIRADEPHRAGKGKYGDSYINEEYPFVDNGITHADVMDILKKAGVGLPDYYKWSKRSGCYFCPFQSKMTWLNLYEHHPDLFMKAKEFEDLKNPEGCEFKAVGWNLDMLLKDMIKPENAKKIRDDFENKQKKKKQDSPRKLINMFADEPMFDEDDCGENQCLFCHL